MSHEGKNIERDVDGGWVGMGSVGGVRVLEGGGHDGAKGGGALGVGGWRVLEQLSENVFGWGLGMGGWRVLEQLWSCGHDGA